MNTVGPISLTLNTPQPEDDPAQGLGMVSAAVQIQNSSAFVLSVLAGGDLFTIQPFFAATIPVTGAPIVITPTQNPQNVSGNIITLVWLLQGEQPPMEDGPLNLPLSTIEQLINAGLNNKVGEIQETTGTNHIVPAVVGQRIILGSLFLQPGLTSSGFVNVQIQVTVAAATLNILVGIAQDTAQPGVPYPFPQGLACDVNTPVDLVIGGTLLTGAVGVATYVLN